MSLLGFGRPLADHTNIPVGSRPLPMELPTKTEVKSEIAIKTEPITSSLHLDPSNTRTNDEPAKVAPSPETAALQDGEMEIEQEPQAYSPEMAFKTIQKHVAHLSNLILDENLALPPARTKDWQVELAKLKESCGPRTVIAVVGATGAGKSSVINALLDQADLVPTNCMRACTAVVTEISYHKKAEIEADIEFLKEAEWRQELLLLKDDLTDEDGNVRRSTDLRSEVGIAYAKFTAVYPHINLDDLPDMSIDTLMHTGVVSTLLGRTEHISSSTSKDFSSKVSKWVDSKEKTRKKKDRDDKEDRREQQEYWPLVKIVRIRVKAHPLATGAVLVDLPGSQDSNAARSAVAKSYMRNADAIWILAPINRAVDDKVAKDLMGDAWRKQALMDGDYNSNVMTFICSKTDDISPREAMRSIQTLRDNQELQDIVGELDVIVPELSQSKKDRASLKRTITRLKSQEVDATAERKEWGDRYFAKKTGKKWIPPKKSGRGKKRKSTDRNGGSKKKKRRTDSSGDEESENDENEDSDRPDAMSDNSEDEISDSTLSSLSESDIEPEESDKDRQLCEKSDDEHGEEDALPLEEIKQTLEGKKSEVKAARGKLAQANKDLKELNKAITKGQGIAKKLHRRKAAICSLARNEYSKDAIKDDFRAGLKELEDAAAEEADPENFDPDEVRRDYDALDLPVFCVSAREYAKLKKLDKADGSASVFSELADTQMPQLQQHAQTITWSGRDAAAKRAIELLRNFARSVEVYLGADGQASLQDRAVVRGIFKDEATILFEALESIAKDKASTLKKDFKRAVRDKVLEGARVAEREAVLTIDEFGESTYWSTYRATMRRQGSWRRDLNEILIQPVIDEIAIVWKRLFSASAKEMFADLPDRMMAIANERLSAVEKRASSAVQDRLRAVREQQQEAMMTSFKHLAESAAALILDLQKDITRKLSPDIAEQLHEVYDEAASQCGRGTFVRMKGIMHKHIQDNASSLFVHTAQLTLGRLDELGDLAFKAMETPLQEVQRVLTLAYNSIWEGIRVNPHQLQRRGTVRQRAFEVVESMEKLNEQAKQAEQSAQFVDWLEQQIDLENNNGNDWS